MIGKSFGKYPGPDASREHGDHAGTVELKLRLSLGTKLATFLQGLPVAGKTYVFRVTYYGSLKKVGLFGYAYTRKS